MTALSCFVAAILLAMLFLARAGWFGISDLPWLIGLTAPLAFGIAAAESLTASARRGRVLQLAIGCVVGLVMGLVWSAAVLTGLGAFAGALSLPVALIWPGAAALGAMTPTVRQFGRPHLAVAVLFLLGIPAPLAVGEAWPYVAGWQTLTVIKLKGSESDAPLSVADVFEVLTPADVEMLRNAGVTGSVEVIGTSRTGRGPDARALVVSMGPLKRSLEVRQPHRTAAVYLQSGERIAVWPKTVVLDRRHLRFESREHPLLIAVWEESLQGWSTGGSIDWRQPR
jgi:hypothetical protein